MINDINHIFSLLNQTPNWKYQLGIGQNALQQKSLEDQLRMFEEQIGLSRDAFEAGHNIKPRYNFTPASDLPYARGF